MKRKTKKSPQPSARTIPVTQTINDYSSSSASLDFGKPDMVNHPPHYTKHPSGVECIEIVRHMPFNIGNAIKYLWRRRSKGNEIEDIEKAIWYLQDEIKLRKGEFTVH